MDIRGRKMKKPPACVQCRKRKIGCDRVKPVCGNCERGNKPHCFYPDVPGKYVQSHVAQKVSKAPSPSVTREKSQTKEHAPVPDAPKQSNRPKHYNKSHTPRHYSSRETNNLLQNNPELASLEQIREYNTRLQLLNAQEQNRMMNNNANNANTNHINNTRYIQKVTPSLDKNPVESAMDSNLKLNWVQGPAIFDQITTPYTQEDILLKEMGFLKSRLLELQDITGKDLNISLSFDNPSTTNDSTTNYDDLLSSSSSNNEKNRNDNSNSNNNNNINIGNAKTIQATQNLASSSTYNISENNKIWKEIDEFRDLDPQFLDKNQIFSIFNIKSQKDNMPINDTPNSIFTQSFLRNRDSYLKNFSLFFHTIYTDNHFEVGSQSSNINENSSIEFPPKEVCQVFVKKYIDVVKESRNIVPIFSPLDILNLIEMLFPNNKTSFVLSELNIDQLITFGTLSLTLLFSYETLASTVLILLSNEQLEMFNVLKDFNKRLTNNLYSIKLEMKRRAISREKSLDKLRFFTLLKLYESISSFGEIGYTYNIDQIDFDEDIHTGIHLSLNYESRIEKSISLWNFICKNYQWRHIMKGEIPTFLISRSSLNSQSNIIVDPLYNNDVNLLTYQSDIIEYLQTKDRILSLDKVIGMKDILKIKYDEQSRKCTNIPLLINNISDSLIYRNSTLYLSYYLLLQYEQNNDAKRFNDLYRDFLQLIQDTIFYLFSNLANKNFAGYEFLFTRKVFILMDTIIEMLLGMYQRSHFAFDCVNIPETAASTTTTNNDEPRIDTTALKQETKQHSKDLLLIIKKLFMLLHDYSKNCKIMNPLLNNTTNKMSVIITYSALLADCADADTGIKSSLVGESNIFEHVDTNSMIKFNSKLKSISESLINSEFYNKREPFAATEVSTLGINKETAPKFGHLF